MGRIKGIFFNPTHHDELKKIQPNSTYHISPTQLNLTQPTWFELNPWVGQLFFITIIIKLRRKNININILKKIQKLVSI